MINDILASATNNMEKSIEAFKSELTKIRTGRAHPSLLEHIMVEYYGNPSPLNQVATVSVEDARTLAVSPWEKTMIQPIEKAIMTANLGLNPTTAGMVIRVPLPPLTEERRKAMVKLVRDEGERSRVSVRNARRDANTDIKRLLKDKAISEDEQKKGEAAVQKITDEHVKQVEQILVEKEKDLLAV